MADDGTWLALGAVAVVGGAAMLSGRGSRAIDLDALIAKTAPKKPTKAQRTVVPRSPRPAPELRKSAGKAAHWYTRLEFVEGGSAKFWEIGGWGVDDPVMVHWGRIDTAGQSQEVTVAEAQKRLKEKLGKGYVITVQRGTMPRGSRSRTGDYAGKDAAFAAWMAEVDKIVQTRIGMSVMDLRDRTWRDAFDDGITPRNAVDDLVGQDEDEMWASEFGD